MMLSENFKMALASIRGARMRSALTMFGIIVGISSVVTVVSLGEGVKQQVQKQIEKLGSDVLVVKAGKDQQSQTAVSIDLLRRSTAPTIGQVTDKDVEMISKLDTVESYAPVGFVSALPQYDSKEYESGLIFATNESLPALLQQNVEFGGFFTKDELNKNFAVIGSAVAAELFGENVPIGKTMSIRGTQFLVSGVFAQSPASGLSYAIDFNHAVIIPSGAAKTIGSYQLFEIIVDVAEGADVEATAAAIEKGMLEPRGGQQDFTVLKQEDTIAAADGIFDQLTLLISGIAVISLIVGGIGIMNIMFALVSERTREIGIRKAIGATNQQILGQFLTEAIVLSIVGSIIGVVISLLINGVLRATTDLQPAITLPIIGIAIGVAAATGIISGILPAAKAAKRDPIEALRYDI